MKSIIALFALTLAVSAGGQAAEARGCVKGAIVGGVAGHLAGHHALMGAAAGCAIGHHYAKKHDREWQRHQAHH
jgi:hypothetical protein